MKTAFVGHRLIYSENIGSLLKDAIQAEYANGCRVFTMGTHGEFDKLALHVCRDLRKIYDTIEIEVVITSLNSIAKRNQYDYVPYADVKTVMYEIEETYFKRQIIVSNRRMIDTCDTLICYVDKSIHGSGAKMALRYAEKRGLKIVNLFNEKK